MITPTAASVDEEIHNVLVRDPFRWLEDGQSPESKAWIARQQHRYDKYFEDASDLAIIRERVRDSLDVNAIDQPAKVSDRYFYRMRRRGCEQACILARAGVSMEERVLVDPRRMGGSIAAAIYQISSDGALLAYERREGGERQCRIHIVDAATGTELPDSLEKGHQQGLAFTNDRSGFFYCLENGDIGAPHAIRFHKLGSQYDDQIIRLFPRLPNSRVVMFSDAINLGAVYIPDCSGDVGIDVLIAPRVAPHRWSTVARNLPASSRPILKNGRVFIVDFCTSPKGSLLELAGSGYEPRIIVPERTEPIQQLAILGNRVAVSRLSGWGMTVEVWSISGAFRQKLDIPADGTIRLLRSYDADTLFLTYEATCQPPRIFELSSESDSARLWHTPDHHSDLSSYTTEVLTVPSKDGTRIPVMLATRESTVSPQLKPTIMTAYGGFGTSTTPRYSVLVSIMLELGYTFALTRIRGGGEFGERWHQDGSRLKHQNSFDDFIAVAEFLRDERRTAPHMLGIFGGSNAGLLVAAAATQRPDLFGAILCLAPLLDMVRYEAFDTAARWKREYGSVKDVDEFLALFAYSPYHHVSDEINYPPCLFVSGNRDDLCNGAHVRKMAARLQERVVQTRPVLVDYHEHRGHVPALPLSVQIESLARRILFLYRELRRAATERCDGYSCH